MNIHGSVTMSLGQYCPTLDEIVNEFQRLGWPYISATCDGMTVNYLASPHAGGLYLACIIGDKITVIDEQCKLVPNNHTAYCPAWHHYISSQGAEIDIEAHRCYMPNVDAESQTAWYDIPELATAFNVAFSGMDGSPDPCTLTDADSDILWLGRTLELGWCDETEDPGIVFDYASYVMKLRGIDKVEVRVGDDTTFVYGFVYSEGMKYLVIQNNRNRANLVCSGDGRISHFSGHISNDVIQEFIDQPNRRELVASFKCSDGNWVDHLLFSAGLRPYVL